MTARTEAEYEKGAAWRRIAGGAPQGDAIRIHNYVRLVRGGSAPSDTGSGDASNGSSTLLAIRAVPNPVSSVTSLVFTLPASDWVRLNVYDIAGRLVTSLLDEMRAAGAGRVQWDGSDAAGRPVRSGIYLATLETPSAARSAKIMLAR